MVIDARQQLPRYQRALDGLVLPVSVASHPALDFCNTLAGWNADEQLEYLQSYAHLAVWAREAALVDAPTEARLRDVAHRDPTAARRQLRAARRLREALYAACTDPGDEESWNAVARHVRIAASRSVLRRDERPGRRWSVADTGLARPVLELARSAGDLLATTDLAHVKACPGTGCGWLFLDPRGRRRWWSMAVCGNRAKARRHAERTRPASGGTTG
jgi:predicted RNA-binding Zn ribbon-like protein